jgi:hypothetical protein
LHATTAGRTSFLINKKTGRLKNPWTIRDPCIYQALSNQTSFRPI